MIRAVRGLRYLGTGLAADGLGGKVALERYYLVMLVAHALRVLSRRLPPALRFPVAEPTLARDVVVRRPNGTFRLRRGTADGWIAGAGYEPHVEAVLARTLGAGDVFVDVGAHVGRFTVMAGRRVGARGCVVAIEPDEENFAALQHNVALNALDNVRAVNVACWSTECELEMIASTPATGCWHRFAPAGGGRKVCARPLDAILRELAVERVDLVKIDVEGACAEVLEGARDSLARSPSARVVFEALSAAELNRSRDVLAGIGFDVRHVAGDEYLAFAPSRRPL